jgi:hypothetical protein
MRHAIAPLTLALAALLSGAPLAAGASSTGFSVEITLSGFAYVTQPLPPGACRSRASGGPAQARVEVSCGAGEFAIIQAFRSGNFFAWGAAPAAGASDMRLGTVTIRRLFDGLKDDADGRWDEPLEMRVTF